MSSRSDAIRQWAHAEPVRDRLLNVYGIPPRRSAVPVDERFEYLARSIAYQQLAGKAAAAIWARVIDLLGGTVDPQTILGRSFDELRSAGLSGAKAASILDLASHVERGSLRLGRLGRLDEQRIVDQLTVVRGIGPWTAHMFVMSALGRDDVWPIGDYGVRVGVARAWQHSAVPTEREMAALGEIHRPFRSIVSRWAWMLVDDPAAAEMFPPIQSS